MNTSLYARARPSLGASVLKTAHAPRLLERGGESGSIRDRVPSARLDRGAVANRPAPVVRAASVFPILSVAKAEAACVEACVPHVSKWREGGQGAQLDVVRLEGCRQIFDAGPAQWAH